MRPSIATPLLLLVTAIFLFLLFQNGTQIVTNQEPPLSPHANKSAEQRAARGLQQGSVPLGGQLELGDDWTEVPIALFTTEKSRKDLLQDATSRSKRDGGYRFATPIAVSLTPKNSGRWDQTPEGNLRWRILVQSPKAHSLNFGFSQYSMPSGGFLRISTPGHPSNYRDFTSADNEAHGELWTPVINGEVAMLEVELPDAAAAAELDLKLAKVNHGFRGWRHPATKIGGTSSGDCNLDVACDADDGFPMVELFRDQIRSVGAYTVEGIDTCTGALINNAAQDNTPYFLTAAHCGINASNAASVVVYWNFESSSCREPNTPASGAVADGDLSQFNTGSIFRADDDTSDFCLIEMDDPIDPSFNLFFSGWSRSSGEASTAVGIHHPGVAEKRISFEFDPTTTTNGFDPSMVPNGTHVRVVDWDIGTTEPGSSGSPLYDQNGLIIGQLHGGPAACGNDDSDYYGRVSTSWIGGGTMDSGLRTWLDPFDTGLISIDGRYLDEALQIESAEISEGNSDSSILEFTVTLSEPSEERITVDWATEDGTASSGSDFSATGGSLTFEPNETSMVIQVEIYGDPVPEEHETFGVVLSNPINAVVGRDSAIGTIFNDDFIPPVLTGSNQTEAMEGRAFIYIATARNTPTSYSLEGAPDGMTIDEDTGEIFWVPNVVGLLNFDIIGSNPAGSGRLTLQIEIAPNPILLAVDLDGEGLVLGESASRWVLQNEDSFDGIDAARSGNIGDNSRSWFELSVTGPETVYFKWKVSSEAGYDELGLFVNGIVEHAISGEVDWTTQTLSLPEGDHILRWQYSKDGSIADGADAGLVDQIILLSRLPYPAILSPQSVSYPAGSPFTYEVLTGQPADQITVSGLPPGLNHDGRGFITGVTPEDSFTFEVNTSNGNGTDSMLVEIDIIAPIHDSLGLGPNLVTMGGAADWYSQSLVTADGITAAQSGNISHDEISWFEIPVEGPDTVSFKWKVSSEECCDSLRVLVDGQQRASIRGERDWTDVVIEVPVGLHTLRWEYSKDGSVSEGDDAGWVDEIVLLSQLRYPLITSPTRTTANGRQPFTYLVETSIAAETIEVTGLPPGLTASPSGLVEGIAPIEDFFFDIVATNEFGSDQIRVQVSTLFVGSIGQALDINPALSGGVNLDGSEQWRSQTSVTHDGVDAAQSGSIGDSQSSSFEFTVQGPGSMSFWWKVSSEQDYDYLEFFQNGQMIAQISGDQDWALVRHTIPSGPSRYIWNYRKDSSVSEGDDAGWVDQIQMTFDTNLPPASSPYQFNTGFQESVTISTATLLQRVTDPDGDPVAITAVRGGNGTVLLVNEGIYYSPSAGHIGPDLFSVSLVDARGGLATLEVEADVDRPDGLSSRGTEPTVIPRSNGSIEIVSFLEPGRTYLLQRSTNGTDWQTLHVVQADQSGQVRVLDQSPPQPTALYRLALP